jgi:hypothetical protein
MGTFLSLSGEQFEHTQVSKCLLPFSVLVEENSEIVVSIGKLRVKRDCTQVSLGCLGKTICLVAEDSKVERGNGVPRSESDGFPVMCFGLFGPFLLVEDAPQVHVGIGKLGVRSQGFLVSVDRFLG